MKKEHRSYMVRIEPDRYQKIRELAYRDKRSIAATVEMLIDIAMLEAALEEAAK